MVRYPSQFSYNICKKFMQHADVRFNTTKYKINAALKVTTLQSLYTHSLIINMGTKLNSNMELLEIAIEYFIRQAYMHKLGRTKSLWYKVYSFRTK